MSNRSKFVQPRPPSRGVLSSPLSYYDVVIHRRKHEGFGFVIISSVKVSEQIPGSHVPHKIGRIIDGSPAARCKQLHVGDRIQAVNGVDIHDLHHGQIVNLIKDSGMSIMLRVVCNPVPEEIPQGTCFSAEIHRSAKGFGFGIRGGREYNMPLYVLRMAEDGPAAECGKIQVGDILLDINGHNATDMLHSHAIAIIKQGGQSLHLVLQKGDGKVPDLEQSGSVQSLNAVSLLSHSSDYRNDGLAPSPPLQFEPGENYNMSKPVIKSPINTSLNDKKWKEHPKGRINAESNSSAKISKALRSRPKVGLWLSPKK